MAETAGDVRTAEGTGRIDIQTHPDAYRHWKLSIDGNVARLGDGRRRERAPGAGLCAQAQLLRSRRRHRALRRDPAAALRASRGGLRRRHLRQAQGVLRRGQHQHARPVLARPQGQFLQVHQRDPKRDRGRDGELAPDLHLRDQRHRGGRRLRARARLRLHHAGRRRLLDGLAAGAAAARGASRHRRADPAGRQAQGAPRPRRFLLHHLGRHARQASGRLEPDRRARPRRALRGDRGRARRGIRRPVRPSQGRGGHRAPPRSTGPSRRRASSTTM